MLRKDVKLGFAIGGIMLAVVVVYVLVVPSGDRKNVSVVGDDSQGKADVTASGTPSDGKTADPETATSANAPPADPSKAGADQTAVNAQTNGQPAGQTSTASGTPTVNQTGSAPAAGNNAASGAADWNKLLQEGSSSPTMMSETPTIDTKRSDAGHAVGDADLALAPVANTAAVASEKPAADQPVANNNVISSPTASATDDKATPDLSIDTASTPATQPTVAGQRTHVVQQGEMLSTIAAAAYGDSRKWRKIAAANPNVNPDTMAPGTKLIIPSLGKASETSSVNTAGAARVDPQTQYQVQPNDSLYRISIKLYGKPNHVDKLYQANKDVIGADPKRLKLNMVLKLTDPPTVAAAQ